MADQISDAILDSMIKDDPGSRVAVETVEGVYANASDGNPHAWLVAGFQAAHQRILDEASRNPALAGMGTTCTAIALPPCATIRPCDLWPMQRFAGRNRIGSSGLTALAP